MFQEEATETADLLDVKDKESDGAKISDLGDWQNDGVIDRNRGMWRRSWLPAELRSWEEKQVEMQRLKYQAEIQKRGQE